MAKKKPIKKKSPTKKAPAKKTAPKKSRGGIRPMDDGGANSPPNPN